MQNVRLLRRETAVKAGPLVAIFFALPLSAAEIVVARDGSGNFTSVQAAVDSVPAGNSRAAVIHIKPGAYTENITVPAEKPFITMRGDDAARTILTFHNSAASAGGTSKSASVYIWAADFTAENLTFENSYGTGSQAVALYVNADRARFLKCRFLGWQDTLYANGGRQHYKDCYIEGHVDFIFGNATALFEDCEIHSKGQGYVTAQSRLADTPATGYVFRHCRLTGSNTGNGVYLGRPWRPYARVVYIDCWLGEHIRPQGWDNWRNPENEKTAWFAEYHSTGPGANAGSRVGWSKQLTAREAEEFASWGKW
jgi:pectinesterase